MLIREEVLKIAKLARLDLSDAEIASYQKRLGRVLEYVNELKTLETSDDAFVRHIPRDAVAFREDVAIAFPNPKSIMANAPTSEENQFLLPTIVEHS